MLLEEIKNISTTKTDLKKFGLMLGILALIIAGLLFWKQNSSFVYLAIVGFVLLAAGLLFPSVLKPVYRGWMTIAVVLGFVMTRVILTVLYFGIFTPVSLVLGILRKDLLNQKWDKSQTSYWVRRPSSKSAPKTAERMF